MSQLLVPAPVTESIDGLDFTVVPFPALHALGLMARLMKSLGPVLSLEDAEDADFSKVAPALAQLNPAEAQALALELLKGTFVYLQVVEGQPAKKFELGTREKFDAVFNGRMRTMFKVIGLAMKANFAGFSDGSESETGAPPLPDKSL